MFLDDLNTFLDDLNTFLDDLNINPITDEWYMSNFADRHIKTLESHETFDVLKQFVVFMIERYDEKSEYEIIEILRYLKYQANTNEKFYSDTQKQKIIELYKQENSQNILNEIFSKSRLG